MYPKFKLKILNEPKSSILLKRLSLEKIETASAKTESTKFKYITLKWDINLSGNYESQDKANHFP